ncbi:MAG TPA: GNAT family N-acetyltransferase [Bacteroidia bacterium]|jgi:GNAT superfamily N-acetyltransferase|nr:GNAT family N-acetyltransferase [Bacteroidia bacterium]
MIQYREATVSDIPQLQRIRNAVKENVLSNPNLITTDDYQNYLTQLGKGWVCEIDNQLVGFAIVDIKNKNVWALFVDPLFEKKGIGKKLQELMLDWYFKKRDIIWLGTAPHTRAARFYTNTGWTQTGMHGTKELKFEMTSIDWKKNKNNYSITLQYMKKPDATEYKPYFQRYIDLVKEGDFLTELNANTNETIAFFKNIPENKHNYRYAENKWTIKEVLMHMIDTERGFSYRVLVCARGDANTPLHPMDEDMYAANVDVTHRRMNSLLQEFETVRKSATFLFENLTEAQSKFLGNNITHPISARALGYILIGHVKHHNNVVKERYL